MEFYDAYTDEQKLAVIEFINSNPEHKQAIRHRPGSLWFPYLSMFSAPDPELRERMPSNVVAQAYFGQMLKELPIFALDTNTFIASVSSMMEATDEGVEFTTLFDALDLPPLPFDAIAVEMTPDAVMWDDVLIAGFIVSEVIEGEEWEVIALVQANDNAANMDLIVARVRSGHMIAYVEYGKEPEFEHAPHSPLWMSVVQALHLITARGVEHENLPRPIRREFERKTKRKYPQAFVIKIGTTTTSEASDNHDPQRKLTCRFLVRGHWRHYEHKKTWIRPYVKGPANAPWRAPLNPVRKVA